MSDVSAGAARGVVFDDLLEDEADTGPDGLLPEYSGFPDDVINVAGNAGGKPHHDGEDSGHDHAAELSDTGVTVFNYSQRDRMDGDGGESNKIGYRNFSPVSMDDLDLAEQRRKEADEHLFIVLEQYEAAQRLADLDARIRQLEHEIKELTSKIEAMDRAFDLGNDADINDDTLNGLAKRNRMRSDMVRAGIDPNEYFGADGKLDQEKWLRDQEKNREIQRTYQREVEQKADELFRRNNERESLLRSNPALRDKIAASSAGDPAAQAEVKALGATSVGAVDLSHTILNSSPTLDTQAKIEALTQIGPEGREMSADSASLIVSSSGDLSLASAEMAWGGAMGIPGTSVDIPPAARIQTASVLPETLPELLSPVRDALPAGFTLPPVPDIKLIDLVPNNASAGIGARSGSSFAAELGLETVAVDVKPITSTFAQAASGDVAASQAGLNTDLAANVDQQRVLGQNSGAGMRVA